MLTFADGTLGDSRADRGRTDWQPVGAAGGGGRLQGRNQQFARARHPGSAGGGTGTEGARGNRRRRCLPGRPRGGHHPLKNYRTVPVEPLAGKTVIDTNNYYPARDGQIAELDSEATTTAELLQSHLPRSKVVKAFNNIYAAALTTDAQPAGTPGRRALAIAGDDLAAKEAVRQFIDGLGFDVVDAGPLREGWRFQRATPGYGPRRNVEELRRDLAAARRYADQQ